MTYKSQGDENYLRVEAARRAVGEAQAAYSKGGGSVDKVNAANKQLADAHSKWREYFDGRVPDTR
jgi:hypothetical protein